LPQNKANKEKHWFKLWVTEGYSIRQLSHISGHSQFKLKRIKNYWLSQGPPALSNIDYHAIKYVILDGTYFHKDGCLIVFVDAVTGNPFYYAYVDKESYYSVLPLLQNLKAKGLDPKALIVDGDRMVTRALLEAWPNVIIQRCLFHIERQGLQWLRSFPKTQAGQDLRVILKSLGALNTKEEMGSFLTSYSQWLKKYHQFICLLPRTSTANKDLKRTMSLVDNALSDMFHFIKDRNIVTTTNFIENFFAQLKHKYRGHKGLSLKHRISYLKWCCYYKNT